MKSCLFTAISQPLIGFIAVNHPCVGRWDAPVSAEEKKFYPLALPQKDWTCVMYRSGADLPVEWDTTAPANDLFLSRTYLQALEEYAPRGMKVAYAIFYYQNNPAGVACCQLLTFNGAEHLQGLASPGKNIAQWLKQRVAASTNIPMLICGNMLLTGDHAFYFNPEYADAPTSARVLESAAAILCSGNAIPGFEASAALVKDFEAHHAPFTEQLREEGFHEVPFQPNMRLKLRPEWQKFDDYLEAMSSKYRIRARRAFRKLDGVERRELNLDAILELDEQLHTLYRSVASHADFNMVLLHPRYFSGLKAALKDRFRIWGYFLNGELLGFNSAMYNGQELEAHFLGFQDARNADFQLYLNMLYDMVREAFAT
ncbi:MAG: GNAT family N-acetyltransferase, partial [Saprospiraceae bacterium]|nr:GNAT family N-acetyltransferase [Saprospiraceae bacterium]